MHNPELWKSWKRNDELEKKLKAKIGKNYELRANNIASIGNMEDNISKPNLGENLVVAPKNIPNLLDPPFPYLGDIIEGSYDLLGSIDPNEFPDIEPTTGDTVLDALGVIRHTNFQDLVNIYNKSINALNEDVLNGQILKNEYQKFFTGYFEKLKDDWFPIREDFKDIIKNLSDSSNTQQYNLEKAEIFKEALLISDRSIKELEKKGEVIMGNVLQELKDKKKKQKKAETSAPAKKPQKGQGLQYYKNTGQLTKRLKLLIASMQAGNKSKAIRNEMAEILDILLKSKHISKQEYNAIYKSII
jgi:hypothetical protein